jgi:pilus assembly protein CpaB
MKRSLSMLVLAVVLGLAAAYLSVVYLKAREAQIEAALRGTEGETVSVVVANSDLDKGTRIDAGSFAVREVPVQFVHPDAVRPEQFDAVDGQLLMQPLTRGRPLLSGTVEAKVPVDFSDTIPVGRRAMTIQVDELDTQSGLARPGNRVDLFVLTDVRLVDFRRGAEQAGGAAQPVALETTSDIEEAAAQARSYVIPVLQNVEVLATERLTDEEYLEQLRFGPPRRVEDFTTMTVNVTPEEAALLALAQDRGEMLSILRNREDDGGALFSAVGEDELLLNSFRMAAEAASREAARALDGVTVTADGTIVTKDGIVIKDPNIIVKDGVLMTKDGVVLSGRGLRVTKDGRIVTADGRPVDTSSLRVTADGRLVDASGQVVGAPGAALAVPPEPRAARVTEDGRIIGADGMPIDPGELIVKDGKIMTRDGRVIDDPNLIVTADGRIMTRDGVMVVDRDARVTADGRSPDAEEIDAAGGVTATAQAPVTAGPRMVEFIVGGTSKDGVTPIVEVPVTE